MTDSSFSPADAEGLAAWFTRAEANAAGLRRRLRDFDTDRRPHHQPRQKDLKTADGTPRPEKVEDRIVEIPRGLIVARTRSAFADLQFVPDSRVFRHGWGSP